MRRRLLLLLALALVRPAPAQAAEAAIAFEAGNVGPPGGAARQMLYLPPASGRHPAVLVLHGCNGVHRHEHDWAARLRGWGYVALVVDSLAPRAVASICDLHGTASVTQAMRVADVFAAADWLRRRDDVDPDRIAAVGFSHGATTVLQAVSDAVVRRLHVAPLRAAVALYPGCDPASPWQLASDLLMLLGEKDEWTPAAWCLTAIARAETRGHLLQHVLYEGAWHAFDTAGPRPFGAGHTLGGTAESRTDSVRRTHDFLARAFR